MNITLVVIYVNGVARTRVEDDCLVECTVDGQDGGRDIDVVRTRLTEAFSEIHNTHDIEVVFPELGEVL